MLLLPLLVGPSIMAESNRTSWGSSVDQSLDSVWGPGASDTELGSDSEGLSANYHYLSVFVYVSCCSGHRFS